MKYYQERIETDSKVPAKIYIGKAQDGNCHYPLHWHNNLEFNLVLKGRINGRINGKPTNASEGEFFFVNSGDLHETDAADKNHMSAITILLSLDLMKEYCPDAESYYYDFSDKEATKEKIKNLILECSDLYKEQSKYFELEIDIALRKICLVLLKECLMKRQEMHYSPYEQNSIRNIKKAISFMENNYMDEITLKTVAGEIGMAPTYFSRFFKKTTDETFYVYLTKIRLYYAYMELINSDQSITEIAMNNGFMNVKSFIESFKKVYKDTPKRYRNNMSLR
jgi:AraC family transcriptional regulator, melibiose operon regulatory protein